MATLEGLKNKYSREDALFFRGIFKDATTGMQKEDFIAIPLSGGIDYTALINQYAVKGFSVAGSNFVSQGQGRILEVKKFMETIFNMAKNLGASIVTPAEEKSAATVDEIKAKVARNGGK